jgi:aminopeptidase I
MFCQHSVGDEVATLSQSQAPMATLPINIHLRSESLPLPSRTGEVDVAAHTAPFISFMTNNPTVFHTVDYFLSRLLSHGFKLLSERSLWADELHRGGKYCVQRNGSSLIAFTVGDKYETGNGAAIIAGHIDALTAKLKPISKLDTKAGYVQLGIAPYAGALNSTWWDRDLGIGGRVLVKEGEKIVTKLVKLDWPSICLLHS